MATNIHELYPGKTNAPSAGYPYGSARNITISGDDTGTPWEKVLVNDWVGFGQALLDEADIVPTGDPDEVGDSQYLTAIRRIAGYPGLIQTLALNVDPATVGLRILLLRGDVVAVADYQALVTATYVGDVDNASADGFYKTSDAGGTIRSTSGTYFVLPDFSGRFLRAIDVAGTIDPDADRTMANNQGATVVSHWHSVASTIGGVGSFKQPLGYNSDVGAGATSILLNYDWNTAVSTIFLAQADNDQISGTPIANAMGYDVEASARNLDTSEEPRPYNVAVNFGVWY